MVKVLTHDELDTILDMAGVSVTSKSKTVRFNHKYYDNVECFEVREGLRVTGTYCVVEGITRLIYPRGSEYRHSSLHGVTLTLDYVMNKAARGALNDLRERLAA